jgi:hypothetical protein
MDQGAIARSDRLALLYRFASVIIGEVHIPTPNSSESDLTRKSGHSLSRLWKAGKVLCLPIVLPRSNRAGPQKGALGRLS